jgi:hypothetical protein
MVKQITLTRDGITLVSDEDADLESYSWYPQVARGRLSYANRLNYSDDNGVLVHEALHRVIMGRLLGRPLRRGEYVDHIDGNGLNNVRENLRLANGSQNGSNRRMSARNKSGYKGVSWNAQQQTWCASVCVNYQKFYLGNFASKHDAARAYNAKAIELHGQYARLNVIDEGL